jgi:aminomethyltransferase
MSSAKLKQSPLHSEHVQLGGKMVPYGGWYMPVQYAGILDEHNAVRESVGVFDISHMGEIFVAGPGAEAWLNHMLTNDVDLLDTGECQYTLMLNWEGGVIDDLIVYQYEPGSYLLVVNASKADEDFTWMRRHLHDGVSCHNRSEFFAGLAVQGPQAPDIFAKLFPGAELPQRNRIVEVLFVGNEVLVARTGYTGEDGFELFASARVVDKLWQAVIKAGATPCGLGCRDTLRLEMCYPLNGSDLLPERTPLEAGLGMFVRMDKGDFIGRDVLAKQKETGLKERLAAFRMTKKGPPPRAQYPVFKGGEQVGEITSGSLSPSLGEGIGMAYLPVELAKPGTEIEIDVRGRRFPAVVEEKPLYRK